MTVRYKKAFAAAARRASLTAGIALALGCSTIALAQDHPIPPSQAVPAKRFVETQGLQTAYYDVGEGPVLVLVHGAGVGAALDWGQVIKPLSAKYRVIALDLIGHGDTAKPNIVYTTQTYVEFIGEFLRNLGITHAHFAGESMGGGVVALYAIEAAQPSSSLPKVDKLIITAGAVPVPGKWSLAMALPPGVRPVGGASPTWRDYKAIASAVAFHNQDYLTDDYARDVWQLLASYGNGPAQWFTALPESAENKAVESRFRDHLKDISAPTLIIWGDDDKLVPTANASYVNAAIPGSKLIVFPQTGHAPAIERPQRYVKEVELFLGNN